MPEADTVKPAAMFPTAVGMTQRSRASLDILGAMLKYAAVDLRDTAREEFEASPKGQALKAAHENPGTPEEIAARVDEAKELAFSSNIYRMERFIQRYVAEEMMARNVISVEEKREDYLRDAALPVNGAGGTLELNPDIEIPEYYDGVHYHLAPHGIDEFDLGGKGAGIGRVFKYGGFAAVPPGSNIARQRIDVVEQFRRRDHKRILEIGCGGIGTLMALRKVFPEAELIGCDLNGRGLKEAHRMAERIGMKFHLKQADARATGLEDGSVDAVFSYAVHHEAPVPVNIEMFKEVHRVLKVGGEFVISDPAPFRGVDIFTAVLLEWDNDNREEPYFRETCLASWEDELNKLGFEAEAYALGPNGYPWVTRAVKVA